MTSKRIATAAALPLLLTLGACGSHTTTTSSSTAASSATSTATAAAGTTTTDASATPTDAGTPAATSTPTTTDSAVPSSASTPASTPASSTRGSAVGSTGTVTSANGALTMTLPADVRTVTPQDKDYQLQAKGTAMQVLAMGPENYTWKQLQSEAESTCTKDFAKEGTIIARNDLTIGGEKSAGCTAVATKGSRQALMMLYGVEHAGKSYAFAIVDTKGKADLAAARQVLGSVHFAS